MIKLKVDSKRNLSFIERDRILQGEHKFDTLQISLPEKIDSNDEYVSGMLIKIFFVHDKDRVTRQVIPDQNLNVETVIDYTLTEKARRWLVYVCFYKVGDEDIEVGKTNPVAVSINHIPYNEALDIKSKDPDVLLFKGDPGKDGKDGEQGPPGEKGDKGDKGDPGKDGKDGEQGPPGEKGEKGDKGDPGKDGVDGKDGIDGKDGKDGEQGPPGEKGDKGDKGDPGKDGKDGEQGPPGEKGEKGDKGDPGKDGVDGKDGIDGKDGKDGEQGPPGEKGDKGDKGDPGKDGKDDYNDLENKPQFNVANGPDGWGINIPVQGVIELMSFYLQSDQNNRKVLNVKNKAIAFPMLSSALQKEMFKDYGIAREIPTDFFTNSSSAPSANGLWRINRTDLLGMPIPATGYLFNFICGVTRIQFYLTDYYNSLDEPFRLFFRTQYMGGFHQWVELTGGGSQIASAAVNKDGTISFYDADGNLLFTTTGASVIGADGFSPTATVTQTQSGATVSITDKNGTTTANISNGADGQDYVLTAQDKSDIADIVLSELPTTQGVLYGNTSN